MRQWEGEHQWNIFQEGEDMIIEGAKKRWKLSEIAAGSTIEY